MGNTFQIETIKDTCSSYFRGRVKAKRDLPKKLRPLIGLRGFPVVLTHSPCNCFRTVGHTTGTRCSLTALSAFGTTYLPSNSHVHRA